MRPLVGLVRTSPELAPHVVTYVAISALAKARARRKLARGQAGLWDRDQSSRDSTPVGG
jgi:hypothetical protein